MCGKSGSGLSRMQRASLSLTRGPREHCWKKTDLKNGAASGLSEVLTDRLTLNKKRINQMIEGVKDVIRLPDPVGKIFEESKRPNGLLIRKMRVPLGAVGIIYES